MKRKPLLFIGCLAMLAGVLPVAAQTMTPQAVYRDGPVRAQLADAKFYLGDSNFHGLIQASDGDVYYFLNSHNLKGSVRMYRYSPKTGEVSLVADIQDIVGEDRTKVYPQGKVHSRVFEHKGKLYFTTHAGSHPYYGDDGKMYGNELQGRTYPGGHFMSYDLATGKFEDFGIGYPGEGLISLVMDKKRGRLYTITWPMQYIIYYDLNTREKRTFKYVVNTKGVYDYKGLTKVHVTRNIGLDPRTGNAYFHDMNGGIVRYTYETDTVETLDKPRLDRPFLQTPNDYMDYETGQDVSWRSIRWSDSQQRFYGFFHYNECLFSYEPISGDFEIIDRIAGRDNRKSGGIYFGALAYELSPDGNTVYYITTGSTAVTPGTSTEQSVAHLVTFDIPMRRYTDHGPIVLDDGRMPTGSASLWVGRDGKLYAVGYVPVTVRNRDKMEKILEAQQGLINRKKLPESVSETNLLIIDNPLAK